MKLLILTEKPSAKRNFSKALGGDTGYFEGDEYTLVASRGHLMEFPYPEKMAFKNKEKYENWTNLSLFPWDENDLSWDKKKIKGTSSVFQDIKSKAKSCDAIVIATDDDPSGEGDGLGWEIVNEIGWNKAVYRIRFADESPKSITEALRNKKDVTDEWDQGEFLEFTARERFDLLSMQLSRIALIGARHAGEAPTTLRLGRLKSAIIDMVYDQEMARKNYVKKPFYAIRYKDNNGNVFSDKEETKYDSQFEANKVLPNFGTLNVVIESETAKKTSAPLMPDLGRLSVAMAKKGYSSKEVLSTYQKMYEDRLVSYPRTEDKKITPEQFNELLPLTDKIARVAGIDPAVITSRVLGKKWMVEAASHGANRPGTNVPDSLDAVRNKYGNLGADIYTALAKSFLAIMAGDYQYKEVKAKLENSNFRATIKQTIDPGYKRLLVDEDTEDKQFGTSASPFIFQGSNTKPQAPDQGFVIKALEKGDIGTGATRVSSIAEISSGARALMKAKKGEGFQLTYEGLVQAEISKGTMIASVDTTKKLLDEMKQVKEKKLPWEEVPRQMKTIVNHDLPIMIENSKKLRQSEEIARKRTKMSNFPEKEKVEGVWNGENVRFNREWSGHRFSDEEVKLLLEGQTISITATSSSGKPFDCSGKLEKQEYNGNEFVGFKAHFENKTNDADYAQGVWNGQNVRFKKNWRGHELSDVEIQTLLAGKEIVVRLVSKAGKPYSVSAHLAKQEYKGHKFVGLDMIDFVNED